MSRSRSVVCSQCRISSIFCSTNKARRGFSWGATGDGPLVLKLVDPIKLACSRPRNEFEIQQLLISQANPEMRATHTAVLGKTNSAARKESARFNLIGGGLNQLAKLLALLFINGGSSDAESRCVFSNENKQSNTGDSSLQGITDQLWIECRETLWLFRIEACGRLPI